jgi:hypothetical protein
MPRQANTRPFEPGDRVIVAGEFIGTLVRVVRVEDFWSKDDVYEGSVPYWEIEWEDGANETLPQPEPLIVYANGGPTSAKKPSARRSPEWKALVEAAAKLGTAAAEFQAARKAFTEKYPKGEEVTE